MKVIHTNETWELQPDGTSILIHTEEVEIDEPSVDDLVDAKTNEILRIYDEIMELKLREKTN